MTEARIREGWWTVPCLECCGRGWWRIGSLRQLRATSVWAWLAAAPAVVRRRPCRFCDRTGRILAFPASECGHTRLIAHLERSPYPSERLWLPLTRLAVRVAHRNGRRCHV